MSRMTRWNPFRGTRFKPANSLEELFRNLVARPTWRKPDPAPERCEREICAERFHEIGKRNFSLTERHRRGDDERALRAGSPDADAAEKHERLVPRHRSEPNPETSSRRKCSSSAS